MHSVVPMIQASEPNLQIVLPVVSGFFALLGSFVGAWLARRTEYEKWLLQNKSETFGRFLDLITTAQKNAIDAFHDSGLSDQQQDGRVTEIYLPALQYGRVVRLYLQESNREQFSQLAKAVFDIHSDRHRGNSRLNAMEEKLHEIQRLLESELHG